MREQREGEEYEGVEKEEHGAIRRGQGLVKRE